MTNFMSEKRNIEKLSFTSLVDLVFSYERLFQKMKCCENCKHYKPSVTVDETIGNSCEDFYNGCNNCVSNPFNKWELKK